MISIVNTTAEGFLSIGKELTVDFSPSGVIELSGRNGAGKTSIIEATSWCLFGSKDRDTIINDNCKSASVTVNVDKNGEDISVTRTAKRTKTGMSSTLVFTVDGEKMTDGLTAKEKSNKLNEILSPITPEAFSAFFRHEQDGTFEFFTSTPLNRHRMLTSIHPGLAGWTQLHAGVKKRKKELDKTLTRVESTFDEVTTLLEDTISSLAEENNKWNFDVIEASKTMSPDDSYSVSPASIVEAHNNSVKRIEELENNKKSYAKREKLLGIHEDQARADVELAKEMADLTKDFMSVVNVDSTGDASLMSAAKQGECSVCGHDIDNPEHTIECIEARDSARSLLSSFYLPGIKNFAKDSQELYRKLKSNISSIESDILDAEKSIEKEQRNVLSDDKLEELKNTPEKEDNDNVAVISSAGRISRLQEEVSRLSERQEELAKEKKEVSDRVAVVNDIFSKTRESGIPASIAADFAGYLEGIHNEILSDEFRSPDVEVSYSGSSDDEISISASFNGDDMRPISTLSGGERAMIVVSGAFAMAKAAKKIGIDMGTLFLDEPFHGLDRENIVKVSEGVSNCTGDAGVVKTSVLVSHSDFTTDSADTTYRISRDTRGYTKIFSEVQ